jgi:hypothetical protein
VGTCPVGWYTSGSYCVPSRATPSTRPPEVIQKVGTCPLGWSTQSNYCITRGAHSGVEQPYTAHNSL